MRSMNMDSKILQFFAHLADLILLSFCFVITNLPIITIGTSMTALYGIFRQTEHPQSSIIRRYWHHWCINFRPSLICWLIQLTVSALLLADISLLKQLDTTFASVLLFASYLLLLLINLSGSIVYPQIAYYKNTIRRYWQNAFLMLLSKCWLTIPNILLFLLPELLLLVWPNAYFFCLIVRLFPGVGLQFYLSFLLIQRLFQLIQNNNTSTSAE